MGGRSESPVWKRGWRRVAALGLACLAFAFMAASASAGEPPEAPLTEACAGPVTPGDGQAVCGTLNPGSSAAVGYYFAYNVGSNCTGGARTPAGPEVEGEGIAVSAILSGLAPDTTYSYCLVATNQFGETAGEPWSFRTPARQSPVDESTTSQPAPLGDAGVNSPPWTGGGVGLQQARRRFLRRIKACRTLPAKRRARCRRLARASYSQAHRRYEGSSDSS